MADRRFEILQGLADAVVDMDDVRTVELAQEALAEGLDAYEAITEGLARGMDVVSVKYDLEEYFVPEILLCSDAMYAGITVLKPHIRPDHAAAPGRVVIGVAQGDTHDIGKNIVRIMLEAAGFEMHDLGRNVAPEAFVETAVGVEADLIAMSTLMSTTRDAMRETVSQLREAGVRDRFRVMIGGPPVSWKYCREIGADAYGGNAADAVRLARDLMAGVPVGQEARP